jgi:hypothetical protein
MAAGGDWWRVSPAEQEEADARIAAGQPMLERKWALIQAHRDQHLKIWDPLETGLPDWHATWLGPPQPGEHREADEATLYDWLEASLGPGGRM